MQEAVEFLFQHQDVLSRKRGHRAPCRSGDRFSPLPTPSSSTSGPVAGAGPSLRVHLLPLHRPCAASARRGLRCNLERMPSTRAPSSSSIPAVVSTSKRSVGETPTATRVPRCASIVSDNERAWRHPDMSSRSPGSPAREPAEHSSAPALHGDPLAERDRRPGYGTDRLHPPLLAVTSSSTRAPLGRAAAWTVDRAGYGAGKAPT